MGRQRSGMFKVVGVAALSAGWAGGCATHQPPPPPPPMNHTVQPEALDAVRAKLQAANPDVKVGRVAAVRSADMLLAVGDVDVTVFNAGDVITIADGDMKTITMGKVDSMDKGMLIVRYEPVAAGGPQPVPGDLAIRAIK